MNDFPVLREKGKHPQKERNERIPKKGFCYQKEREKNLTGFSQQQD
jgi:hypothetical protein